MTANDFEAMLECKLIEAMQNKRDLRVVLYLLPLKHYHLQ
jgi:hypothetical protein